MGKDRRNLGRECEKSARDLRTDKVTGLRQKESVIVVSKTHDIDSVLLK